MLTLQQPGGSPWLISEAAGSLTSAEGGWVGEGGEERQGREGERSV